MTNLKMMSVEEQLKNDFFTCVREFYVTVISKMLNKFPFTDNIIKELSFLDPRHRSTSSCSGIISLASRFTSFTEDELDNLSMEFRDFRSSSDSDLPEFNPKEHAAIEHFWDAMSKVKLVNESKFETLAALAKVLLILPHSNADPERLFSMVRKIETEQRKNLDPSTVCDLLSVKLNIATPCFENEHLMSKEMLKNAKSATKVSLASKTPTVSEDVDDTD